MCIVFRIAAVFIYPFHGVSYILRKNLHIALCFLDGGLTLDRKCQAEVKYKHDGRNAEEPHLELAGYRYFLPLYAFQRIVPFSLIYLYHKGYKSQTHRTEKYHRQRADPYYIKGLENIIPVRDEHHIHMEDFDDRPQKE